jgi:hypothetical protein
MADQPELEIVLPDGRPVSEYEEPQEDMGTIIDIDIGGEGGVTVEIDLPDDDDDFYANIAEDFDDDDVLSKLASDLLGEFDGDLSARKDWLQIYIDGIELLGLKIEDRSEPWQGACGVYHPLLSEALVKFQSETIMETMPPGGPVKTKVIGKETPENLKAAANIAENMNHWITDKMPEYRGEHERMLWGLGLSGNAFKKVYFDPAVNRPVSIYVPAEDIVVPYGASSLNSAERVTHIMRKTENEVKKLQAAEFYREVKLGSPEDSELDDIEQKIAENMGFSATSDDRYKILEFHVELDLEGYEDKDEDGEETGIALPYVVTIEKASQEVLAIRRNWVEDDEAKNKRQHFIHYPYIPGFGFYAFGLVHLLGSFAKSGTSLIRQLVDAGTLSNLPGGFKTKGMRIKGDDTPIAPAEFRDVDVASGTIRDNIMTLPYKEPSQVLFQLMQNIVEEGRRFASISDMKASDMSTQAPVGTTLAILERTLKVMSSVQARIHAAMKQEFQLLAEIIKDNTSDNYSYNPSEGDKSVKREDYDMVEIVPVSNPNSSTMAQKVVQYQTVLQLAQTSPELYDLPTLHKQMLQTIGVQNVEKLIPTAEDQKPKDPVSENMDIISNKPAKAFLYQDHESHIKVHMNAMQDPVVQKLMANNPNAEKFAAALQTHIAEHLALGYRIQIEKQLGTPLPPQDEQLPPEIEVQLSRLLADASDQLLQKNQAEAQQEQAQEQAQDPMVQMQQQELQLKQGELQRKAAKDQADNQIAQAELQLETAKLVAMGVKDEAELNLKRIIEGAKLELNDKQALHKLITSGVKDEAELNLKRMIEGAKIGNMAGNNNRPANQ